MGKKHVLGTILILLCMVASAPVTSILDTFTGTDNTSPPSANWTNAEIKNGADAASGCNLEDNAVSPNGTTSGARGCYWSAASFSANQEVYATIVNVGSNSNFGICGRLANEGSNTTDGYCLETEDATDSFTIYRLDNAAPTSIFTDTPGGQVTVGDKFLLTMIGDQICAHWNDDSGGWVQLGCATDSTYSSGGHIGVYMIGSDTVGAMDDFGGGDLASSSQMRRRLRQ